MDKIKVAVFSNAKLIPAFNLVSKLQPVIVYNTDWSLHPARFVRNIKYIILSDIVYLHSPSNLRILLLPIAKILGKKTMVQWIGGDALIATHNHRKGFYDVGDERNVPIVEYTLSGLRGIEYVLTGLAFKLSGLFVAYLKLFVDHHVACAQHIVDELRLVNISSTYLPIVNPIVPEIIPWPEEFSLLLYIGYFKSSDTKDYYGWKTAIRLAKDYEDLKIYVIGRGTFPDDMPQNMIFLDFVEDIKKLFTKVKGVLRVSYYDGTPRLLVEALAAGRYVAYTRAFPCCELVSDYSDARRFVEKIRDTNGPNRGGYEYILENYSVEETTANYLREFNRCLNR